MKKRIVSVFMALFFIFTSTNIALAVPESPQQEADRTGKMVQITQIESKNTMSKEQKNKALVKRGVKEADAANFPEALVDEILKEKGDVVSYTTKVTNFNESGDMNLEEVSVKTIPLSQLAVWNVCLRIYEYDQTLYDNYKFITYAHWNQDPTWRLMDCIGTCWNGGFTIYSDSCTYSAQSNGNTYSWACPRNKVTPSVGIAHDVDLRTGYSNHEVVETTKVYKSNTTGTANVVSEYGHESVGLSSISASISTSGIGMTVGFGSYIEKAIPGYGNFNY